MNTFEVLTQSESNEWYTPLHVLDRVKKVMNGIDLDPASSAIANKLVQAERFYSEKEDGMLKPWNCRTLFLNPPYGTKNLKKNNYGSSAWLEKFYDSAWNEEIAEAGIVIARGDSRGLKLLLRNFVFVECDRINFMRPTPSGDLEISGAGVPGTKIFYFGQNTQLFIEEFGELGVACKAIC